MTEITYASPEEVRAIFNADVLPRVPSGDVDLLIQSRSAASPSSGQPPGTSSERVLYFNRGLLIAIAHRFVLPDGSIGGSGRPDPKGAYVGF